MGASGITRVFPDLSDDLLLNLFHKGAHTQWTSRDLDWTRPTVLSPKQRLALARLLTPVYFGEQTAMAGASSILPRVMAAGETTAQLYLASFIMDEARHFETLTRLYKSLGHDPLGLREIPELLRYHHRIRQGDRADWVWGILFSDVIAKHFYRAFGVNQAPTDPLFGSLSTRILQDESRHLAFAEHYLRRNVAGMPPARRRALIEMRDDLYRILQAMTERVRADAAAFDVDADDYLGWVWTDVEAFGKRIGLLDQPPDAPDPGDAPDPPVPPPPRDGGPPSPAAPHQPSGVASRQPSHGTVEASRAAAEASRGTGDGVRRPGNAEREPWDAERATWEAERARPDASRGTPGSSREPWEASRAMPDASRRTGAASRGTGGASRGGTDEARYPSADAKSEAGVARCFGCLLILICARRLAPA